MGKYAEKTSVGVSNSRSEIEKTLVRYGAAGFAYGWEDNRAVVSFRLSGVTVRFQINMPDLQSDDFQKTDRGRPRKKDAAIKSWEQAQRQRWRALNLVIKAKLEAIDSGITTFEEEFLAHIMLHSGATIGNIIMPQLDKAISGKKMPKLLT